MDRDHNPEPKDVPPEFINPRPGHAISLPHEQVLLRWTSAIREKARKLLGAKLDGKQRGYLAEQLVGTDDVYVIAVNGYLLRGGSFPLPEGISQFPCAVEATLAVGPIEVRINKSSGNVVGQNHSARPTIFNRNRSEVEADIFFDNLFKAISAVWALDVDELLFDEELVKIYPRPMDVIHNPKALNPLAGSLLPAHQEYFCEIHDTRYVISSRPGRNFSILTNEFI